METSHRLFDAIDAFLYEKREEGRVHACRSFWERHGEVSRAEMEMLSDLSREPLCPSAIASRLMRDLPGTLDLLDALESIGLVERCGERYRTTPATALYCWSLREDETTE